ncbi:MAG: isoprenylcysteine carboxylmethyltransferase family protein [Fibrobacter sp.]|jgi:protein-S-isoprenylcysteine O-methyltransferase Ste14|nr:isoprenylcysteine carboxylmethyltransferase family protein [Fibrobacter sp.]
MKEMYKYRGIILGCFAFVLLLFPHRSSFFSPFSIIFLSIGVFFRVEARRVIGAHSRHQELKAPYLVTTGIYGYLRHPLYLSNMLIGSGFVFAHLGNSWLSFFLIFLYCLFIYRLSKQEDVFLEKLFGVEFLEWKKHTKAFYPQKPQKKKIDTPKKEFITAFKLDSHTWIWLFLYSLLLMLRSQ